MMYEFYYAIQKLVTKKPTKEQKLFYIVGGHLSKEPWTAA